MNDRAIDALIAKHLFGWKEWKFDNPSRSGGIAFSHEGLVPPEYDGSDLQHLSMIVPHYSSDISAAFEVWERLKQRQDYVGFGISHNINYDTYRANYGLYKWAEAQSPALAICLAALKAVSVDIDHPC